MGRSRSLPHDFYITRFYEGNRQRTLVVMLQAAAWEEIDGDTVAAFLHEATQHFPAPVMVTLAQGRVVIAAYDVWKTKVLSRQQDIQE